MPVSVEYEAARSGVALMPRPWRTLVSVEGEGRVSFLQGMLSNEIQALAAGHGCRALLLDNKGKVQADLDLWVEIEAIILACDAAVAENVLAGLRKYVLATPVQFRELDDEQGVVGLVGPGAVALLEGIGIQVPPDTSHGHIRAFVAGVDVRLARTTALAAEGFEIHLPREAHADVATALRKAGDGNLLDVGSEAAEVLRVEAGLPREGSELTGEQFPQEVRLDDAISYDKGCYLGQETVARIHYRGNVNRLLVGLRFREPVARGDSLFAQEKEIGEVTSVAVSPRLGPIGLGYVRRELAAAGTELALQTGDGEPLTAEVADLPFQPEGE
jgi:folate-binding protein YgfZ